jgi:ADP-ribosyl-[dinitrogen reductase] hydrolase
MNASHSILDRARGCLFGLAVGDAIGAQVEFKPRGSFPPVTGMVGGGPWRAFPGMWTDDTSMAFAMADAIVTAGGWNPHTVMDNFCAWSSGEKFGPSDGRGCFDIGGTTSGALSHYRHAPVNPFAGSDAAHTAANGCLMRLAPVPIYTLTMEPSDRQRIAAQSSRLTHGEARCLDATRFFAELLQVEMLAGASVENVPAAYSAATSELQAVLAAKRWEHVADAEIRSGGYVLDTLEAAMWAVYGAKDFRSAVLAAVNLGGDADTVGAVAGQLAGARFGFGGIPQQWRTTLDRGDELLSLTDSLYRLSGATEPAAAAEEPTPELGESGA